MKCRDIIDVIESTYPLSYALEWDNVGLLAGREDKEVERIYIAVDATDEVIREAIEKKADMLITHHPLIFGGLKKVTSEDFMGRRLLSLIQNDICCYAMHTNYDVLQMGELAGERLKLQNARVLEVTCEEDCPRGIGRVGEFDQAISLKQCVEKVKESFGLDTLKVFGAEEDQVKTIAISPGSGKSMIGAALSQKADVLITGDIDHHTGLDALSMGIKIIDAGHYGLEYIFMKDMEVYLKGELEKVEVETAPKEQPFKMI